MIPPVNLAWPMPRLLIAVFVISAFLHVCLQHEIAQCRRTRNQAFYSGWFAAGWPYAAAWGLIQYGLPQLLTWIGFGPLGILRHSIAALIQSVYGISSIFSLLQSIGARGGVSNSLLKSIGLGSILQTVSDWLWGHDYIAQCVNYYEWWLSIINLMDLVFVVCFAIYWFCIR